MADETNFSFPLYDIGPEEAAFRLDNEPNELQRKHWAQYRDSDLSYQVELFTVTHGTIAPGGNRGVLMILDFHFAGSVPKGRRFKHVEVMVAFGQKDKPIGSKNEPIVRQMAPHGTFGLDGAMENVEVIVEGNAAVNAGPTLATIGIGGKFQRKTTVDNTSYAMLHGLPWIHKRNSGEQNAARWQLSENYTSRNGVPPQLRTAILVEVSNRCNPFQAELTVSAKVDTLYDINRAVRYATYIAPVYFDTAEGERKDIGLLLEDVTPQNLIACNLASIGTVKTPTVLDS